MPSLACLINSAEWPKTKTEEASVPSTQLTSVSLLVSCCAQYQPGPHLRNMGNCRSKNRNFNLGNNIASLTTNIFSETANIFQTAWVRTMTPPMPPHPGLVSSLVWVGWAWPGLVEVGS